MMPARPRTSEINRPKRQSRMKMRGLHGNCPTAEARKHSPFHLEIECQMHMPRHSFSVNMGSLYASGSQEVFIKKMLLDISSVKQNRKITQTRQ